ncbi:MAG: hypothetical protein QXL34_06550 [Thermosphaera sp.]
MLGTLNLVNLLAQHPDSEWGLAKIREVTENEIEWLRGKKEELEDTFIRGKTEKERLLAAMLLSLISDNEYMDDIITLLENDTSRNRWVSSIVIRNEFDIYLRNSTRRG